MKKYTVLSFIFSFVLTFSQKTDSTGTQLRISGNYEGNGQWYNNDVQRDIKHDSVPLRSNNYLSINASMGKFSAGLQIESYVNEALLNYNPKYSKTNIGTYFVNYKSEKFDITSGYFYEQFGSGLALRSWEDRSLGINNALRGGRIKYNPTEQLSLTVLYGKQRTGFDVSKGTILGFNTEFSVSDVLFPYSEFKIAYGGSFVNRHEALPENVKNINTNTFIISNRIALEKNELYLNVEYDYKSKDALLNGDNIDYSLSKPGNALLINLGYSQKGFGIDANLRRIENMYFLSEREPERLSGGISTNFNDRILNYIPALTKQHHSNLANIYVYQAQSRISMQFESQIEKFGEIGGQIDVFYEFKKGSSLGGKYGTKIAANASSWYNLKADYTYFDSSEQFAPDYTTRFLATDQKYFSEYNIEISKKITSKLSGNVAVINQYYNDQYIRGIYQKSIINSTILFAEAVLLFSKSRSLIISGEHMWVDEDRKNWLGGSLEYTHNKNWSFFISDSYNYGFDPDAEARLINHTDLFDIHFYNVGATYRRKSTRISLNYGRQRGGLVCAGGVCRYVPPSTGLGIQLNTNF